jgi:hypothetical protein
VSWADVPRIQSDLRHVILTWKTSRDPGFASPLSEIYMHLEFGLLGFVTFHPSLPAHGSLRVHVPAHCAACFGLADSTHGSISRTVRKTSDSSIRSNRHGLHLLSRL